MQQYEVSLMEMLDFRDKKVNILQSLREDHKGCVIITLGMNVPGPRKNSEKILSAFNQGKSKVLVAIEEGNYKLKEKIVLQEKAGNLLFVVLEECDTKELKRRMVNIEEAGKIGRLYDIDVYRIDGTQLSRSDIGAASRRCFICGKDAKVCGRNRTHSVEDLVKKTRELLHAV